FALVLRTIPTARLKIVGAPGYAPRQLSLLESFAYRGSVEYRSGIPRSQVPRAMHEAAVFVQTSENENFGSAVAEAIACGVPVVVGPTNGTADYLDESSAVFEHYEPAAVADSILRVLDKRRRAPVGVSSAARAAAE